MMNVKSRIKKLEQRTYIDNNNTPELIGVDDDGNYFTGAGENRQIISKVELKELNKHRMILIFEPHKPR